MFSQLLVAALTLPLVLAQQPADVANAFVQTQIVPDVVPSVNFTGLLDVVFTDANSQTADVTPGQNLSVGQVALRPQFSLTSNDSSLVGQSFVLVMVDPDAPTPQNRSLGEVRHLVAPLVVASGADLASGAALTNTTPAVSDYVSPGPPPGSDPHRYTLLLFLQPDNFARAASGFVNASTEITKFNLTTFAQELGLGVPVAGNFFFTGPAADTSSSTTSLGSTATTSTVAVSVSTSTLPPTSGSDKEGVSLFKIILDFVFGGAAKEATVTVSSDGKVATS